MVDVLLQIRRELKENRSEPIAERRRVLQQELDGARAFRLQSREMRDTLARLDREGERLGNLARPRLQNAFLRKAIERVVDLHRRETRRVKTEHRVVFELRRVERALPFLEGEAARSRVQLHEALTTASLGLVAVRLAFSASMRSMIFVPPSGATSDVMSWPSTLRWIASSTRSRTVSLNLSGSKFSVAVCSMSCLANASSAGFTSPSGMVTSVVGRTSCFC